MSSYTIVATVQLEVRENGKKRERFFDRFNQPLSIYNIFASISI